ncbi:unnamed protein product [Paramecium sonneborni]|uniref:Uncharacterized protein n=1 Tax=Paramecium sonneborni TaxID=65129 RepID=A0A8S1L2R5_9CILI|nr:unnamed protein product [Paramecium sonneborni]
MAIPFKELKKMFWLKTCEIFSIYLNITFIQQFQFYMIQNSIIHKQKTKNENESEKRIKGILDLEVYEKLQSLNSIQSQKFPNVKKELNIGCIIYNFPIRPQDYKHIYDSKQIPSKLQTIQYDNFSSFDNAKLQLQASFDQNNQSITNNSQAVKSSNKRFSITQSISQIQKQIQIINNKNNRLFQTSLRQEQQIALLPSFYLRKKVSQSMSKHQSQHLDFKQVEPTRRGKSVSQIVSYASRPQTSILSKENRYIIQ